jgi:hypothetical protein
MLSKSESAMDGLHVHMPHIGIIQQGDFDGRHETC